MEFYQVIIVAATVATGLVAGLFFTFSTLIMPGLGALGVKDYIRAFQSIDKILQPNGPRVGTQPVFALVFFGALVCLLASVVFGWAHLSDGGRLLLAFAVLSYAGGMIAPTLAVNLPLNNQIQTYDTSRLNESKLAAARNIFETRWNRWNLVRTSASATTHVLLVVLSTSL